MHARVFIFYCACVHVFVIIPCMPTRVFIWLYYARKCAWHCMHMHLLILCFHAYMISIHIHAQPYVFILLNYACTHVYFHFYNSCIHWLDVPQSIKYKLCVLTFECIHKSAPGYLSRHCKSVSSLPGRSQLRSAAAGQLVVPFSKTKTLGDKGFRYLWSLDLEQSVFRASWSNHVSVVFQKASENFSVLNSISYHAIYAVPFIIYLILTVDCWTVSRSIHCPFKMACH